MNRRLLAVSGMALLAGFLGVALLARHPHAAASAAATPVPVRVETVHLQDSAQVSRYAAVIVPRIEASVGFRVGGKITERLVELGDRVEAGTPLGRLDAADLELQAASTASQLAGARADAANAKADFDRYARLRQGEWTTQQEYEKRRTAMETTAAHVRDLEAALRLVKNNAQYATLAADGPGVVTAVLAEPGQVMAAGQPVFKVARLGTLEAEADVPEQSVAAFSKGDIGVELWSMPGKTLRGHLREMAPSADAGTRTYRARITLDDPPPGVQLGMTATIVEQEKGEGPVAVLPATALASRGSEPAVFVVGPEGDRLELKPVAVASYMGERVVLGAGLRDGDRVVTAGVQKLDTGERVRVWTEPVR